MMFNRFILVCFFILSAFLVSGQIKIACVGAGITEGSGIENPKENSFPGQLQSLLGTKFVVTNYGVSGSTMLKKGTSSYWNTQTYRDALQSQPDIVFIDWGGNDAKVINHLFYSELEQDAREMIRSFKNLPCNPRIIVLLPIGSFDADTDGIYDPICRNEVYPRLQKAAYEEGIEILDLYPLLIGQAGLQPDKIHHEEKVAKIIAKRLFQQIIFPIDKNYDVFNVFKQKKIPYSVTNFLGYECAEFIQNGRECRVVKPHKVAANRPWNWRIGYWAYEPWVDVALLEKGYHLVFCDHAEQMDNVGAVEDCDSFYQLLCDVGLNPKTVLEVFAKGGVGIFNWATSNPDKIATVCIDNSLSYMKSMCHYSVPKQNPANKNAHAEKGNIGEATINKFEKSPVDKINAITSGAYPVLVLCDEKDEAVDDFLNTCLVEKKIKENGGDISVVEKKSFRHHSHDLANPAFIVDFIEKAASNSYFPTIQKYDSYKGLAMAGYQGWFSCPDDGAGRGWYHYWGRDGEFRPGSCKIDMWPDVSEYDKVYKTEFVFADGSPAYTMSSWDESTVKTHFRWMREYGIDGVFVQRFVEEIKRPASYRQLNKVWHSAINSANANNRAISVMYDFSGMIPGDEQFVLDDIDFIASRYDIFERIDNPSYLFHNSKPLVAIWGVGFNDNRKYGFREAEIVIDALKARGYSILIGVPTYWRSLRDDTLNDKELHRLIMKCDIVMPWFVGRFRENNISDMKDIVAKDMEWCVNNNIDYSPLAYPGFSWLNMAKKSQPIPRNRGEFYWQQLAGHINQGAEMLYLAMFDEIDEATAIFKCATQVPVGESYFLALDADLGSDYYLFLAGQAAKALKIKNPALSSDIPNR